MSPSISHSIYTIHEAHRIGKEANIITLYLHDYLPKDHNLDETDLHFQTDNCAGQNKNNQIIMSSELNLAKLVGIETGPILVPTFDWNRFLAAFFISKGIKGLHHFHMDSSDTVTVKESISATKQNHNIVTELSPPNQMPPVIETPGLSFQQQLD
ncbi:hypothetical protein RRG08_048660 [Elysia crispata]|uniref:Uncharacterized protein n=1 Tax=Elysia crispata TaxID=231223 RepID=A0AAE1AE22_9GAST|nr:hypothetical protein RRG08_048660 [Elysia crispata]